MKSPKELRRLAETDPEALETYRIEETERIIREARPESREKLREFVMVEIGSILKFKDPKTRLKLFATALNLHAADLLFEMRGLVDETQDDED